MPEVLIVLAIVAAWLGWRLVDGWRDRRRERAIAQRIRAELRRQELIAIAAATYGRRGVDDRPPLCSRR
jgi:peptidoglycan/LPS O-acetylase OafA/YrhL